MVVVPVIDLLQGVAVHGRGGDRSAYRPITSVLSPGSCPVELAAGCLNELGLADIYLADLDAIQGRQQQWKVYDQLLELNVRLWIDAGLRDSRQWLQQSSRLNRRIDPVFGLETLSDPAAVRRAIDQRGAQRVVASLDMDYGVPRTRVAEWSELDSLSIAEQLWDLGVRRLIVLDVRRVGMEQGTGSHDLLSNLRAAFPELHLTCGGGIRDMADLKAAATAGADAVLLATALHKGTLGRHHVDRLRDDLF